MKEIKHQYKRIKIYTFAITIITILSIILFIAPLFAGGIGGYFTADLARYNWSIDPSFGFSDSTYMHTKAPSRSIGIGINGGLVFDSNCAKDSLFNSRLNIGYKQVKDNKIDRKGVSAIISFGFAPVRTKNIRIWLGPQLNLLYQWCKDSNFDYAMSLFNIPFRFKRKYMFFIIGTGLVFGLNINIGKFLTISFELGATAGIHLYGWVKDLSSDVAAHTTGTAGVNSYGGYCSVAILFRVKDRYKKH